VSSSALAQWNDVRGGRLDEVEMSHESVGGTGPGRRWATRQLNRGYILLIASEFQGACRDLHSEAAAFVAAQAPPNIRAVVERNLTRSRALDRGNANPGNIGSDFAALGVELWPKVALRDQRNPGRRRNVERLNVWRNAIAHDSTPMAAMRRSSQVRSRHCAMPGGSGWPRMP
jgi:hypothetical protein